MAYPSWIKDLSFTFTSVLISLLIVKVSCGDSISKFKRCCSQGSVLSLKEGTYSCKSGPENTPEFISRIDYGRKGQLPVCQNGGNLRTISLADYKNDKFIRGDFCTDIFYDFDVRNDPSDITPVVVVLSCENSNQDWGLSGIPTIVKTRRCCPQGEIFQTKNRACSMPDFPDDDVPTESLLRNIGSLDFIRATRGPPECEHVIVDYEVNATKILFVDGKLQVEVSSSQEVVDLVLTEENSCLDVGSTPGFLVVRACREAEFCRNNSCVRKCCREDEAYVNAKCEKLPSRMTISKWHNEIWNLSENTENGTDGVLNTTEYGVIFGKPCLYNFWPANLSTDHWHIVTEGRVHVPNYGTFEYDQHCIDMFYNHSVIGDGFYSFICHEAPPPPKEKDNEDMRHLITAALSLISCAFLLMTLFVYVCLRDFRNLHGKTLVCYAASLFIAFGCLALVSLATPKKKLDDPNDPNAPPSGGKLCAVWGYSMLFSFFAAFSWLNVMCFDLWRNLGSVSRSGSSGTKRFISYCIFAWGLPFAVLTFAVAVDHLQILPVSFRPDIGNNSCWFASGPKLYGQLTFFIGPLTIQMLVNLVFFILTARRCNLVKADIQERLKVDRSDPRSRGFEANKTKFILSMKLFVFMGISWVMEVISYFFTIYAPDSNLTKKMFYATDVLNLLQGLLIFGLFVMKKKVFCALKKRFTKAGGHRRTSTGAIHDPYRVRKSPSSSTMLSTFPTSSSP